MKLTSEQRMALGQILDHLVAQDGKSHQGYYGRNGWAGLQLRGLLVQDEPTREIIVSEGMLSAIVPNKQQEAPGVREALREAAQWLHAAYDRPPQTPEAKGMLARVDAALAAAPSPAPAAAPDTREARIRAAAQRIGMEALAAQKDAETNPPKPSQFAGGFSAPPQPSAPVARFLKFGESISTERLAFVELLGPPTPDAKLYTAPLPAEAVRVLTPTDEDITAAHEAWQRGNPANPASSFARDEHGQFRSMFMHSMEGAFKAGVRWLATPSAAAGRESKSPRPYIHHSVCRQSGLQELWLMCGDKILRGPAPLPSGWVAAYNVAQQDALDADAFAIAATSTGGTKP